MFLLSAKAVIKVLGNQKAFVMKCQAYETAPSIISKW